MNILRGPHDHHARTYKPDHLGRPLAGATFGGNLSLTWLLLSVMQDDPAGDLG